MPCGTTQDRWVMVEVLMKHGPLEKAMTYNFSILENPMNSGSVAQSCLTLCDP